ncbi:2'-5' RNA ligase [Oceaniovalibus guishaninsula JLT2003]|uniref:RNA 2',3'-cyclic phosphodiesterase n=1 Tax=Oceaniovalibus guishaninsula JLT2003 TaxID=1231392 RepID=K2HRQ0_9RHOB|nr:RNA 2',3'-cyclic phosphodiesterase [Oceaniovalibus guishaninsula]EKE45424.1 2'-5' RNA ligase [Oceaniovalibus guishaninsula JLT2003]
MRVFVAIDLPEDARDHLDRIAGLLPVGRHVPADDMHLTLAFLADAQRDLLAEIDMALDMLPPPTFGLRVAGLDLFGPQDAPRSLHAVIDGGPPLIALQAKVATLVRRAGADLPHRRFVPHVTLARFTRHMPPDDLARLGRFLAARGDTAFGPFAADGLSLVQSTLMPDGPRYDILACYPERTI